MVVVVGGDGDGDGDGDDDDDDVDVDMAHLLPIGSIQVLFIINLIPGSCTIGNCLTVRFNLSQGCKNTTVKL